MSKKTLLSRLAWLLFKQETVGVDAIGNKYYRKLEKTVDGELVEKRLVKYVNFSQGYDPTTVPAEWMQWLHRTRPEPPSQIDIQTGSEQRDKARQQAEDLARSADLAERRFREQQAAGGGERSMFNPQLGQHAPSEK